jgi:hypothetical protein
LGPKIEGEKLSGFIGMNSDAVEMITIHETNIELEKAA